MLRKVSLTISSLGFLGVILFIVVTTSDQFNSLLLLLPIPKELHVLFGVGTLITSALLVYVYLLVQIILNRGQARIYRCIITIIIVLMMLSNIIYIGGFSDLQQWLVLLSERYSQYNIGISFIWLTLGWLTLIILDGTEFITRKSNMNTLQ